MKIKQFQITKQFFNLAVSFMLLTQLFSSIPVAAAPTQPTTTMTSPNAILTNISGVMSETLGSSVAISSDDSTLVAGAGYANSQVGAVYVFVKPAGGWTTTSAPIAKLTYSGGQSGDYLGNSVAINSNGSVIVVGANGANALTGEAYVFVRPAGGWAKTATPTAILRSSDSQPNDQFGASVSISADGSTIATEASGIYSSTNGTGIVYVFVQPLNGWTTTSSPTAALTDSNGETTDLLGRSVAINADGSFIIAGATGVDSLTASNPGAVYVFARQTNGWATTATPTAILTNSSGMTSDTLGQSVSISSDGSTIVAGADGVNFHTGAAYVFVQPVGGWITTAIPNAMLTKPGGIEYDYFGYSVSLSSNGANIVVGAYGVNNYAGVAYSFVKPTGGWVTTSTSTIIMTQKGSSNERIGTSVSINSNGLSIAVGAPTRDFGKGAVYVYTPAQRVLNGGFETYKGTSKIPLNWTALGFGSLDGKNSIHQAGSFSVKISGAAATIKTITQILTLSGAGGDPLTFSFYVKGSDLPTTGLCQATVTFYNGSTKIGKPKILLCPSKTSTFTWKLVKSSFTAPGKFTKINIKFTYSKASGSAWVDEVSLTK